MPLGLPHPRCRPVAPAFSQACTWLSFPWMPTWESCCSWVPSLAAWPPRSPAPPASRTARPLPRARPARGPPMQRGGRWPPLGRRAWPPGSSRTTCSWRRRSAAGCRHVMQGAREASAPCPCPRLAVLDSQAALALAPSKEPAGGTLLGWARDGTRLGWDAWWLLPAHGFLCVRCLQPPGSTARSTASASRCWPCWQTCVGRCGSPLPSAGLSPCCTDCMRSAP